MQRLIVLGVAGLLAAAAVPANAADDRSNPPPFDPPLASRTVLLGQSDATAGEKREVRCYTFAHLMVKEIDAGEIGDEQISILPLRDGMAQPACQETNLPDEVVIPVETWSGYFLGVKGDNVFLTAEDGVNTGIGFAVFRGASNAPFFQDAVKFDGDKLLFATVEAEADGLRLRFNRVYSADCSVPVAGAACWAHIAAETHLPPAPAPDCAGGYARAKRELAEARCEAESHPGDAACIKAELARIKDWDRTPSVIGYDVTALVRPGATTISPAAGVVACWPSD